MLKPRGSSLSALRSSLYFDLGEAEEVSRHIYKGWQQDRHAGTGARVLEKFDFLSLLFFLCLG
ncbi:hypothetical protein E1A91_A10G175900v1 [Gossypium mustelinum]|uniref:Uncharacterized protein n=1 Tax=Gossypium mustelinum TaxID=34275 RepID=A0A5D2XQS4_GOSMU|nr:hypothetical protein E1A91_A10G175900v1 [Gossypium mustelinum]